MATNDARLKARSERTHRGLRLSHFGARQRMKLAIVEARRVLTQPRLHLAIDLSTGRVFHILQRRGEIARDDLETVR